MFLQTRGDSDLVSKALMCHGHSHCHRTIILATHPEGKWTTNTNNPPSPSTPAQAQQRHWYQRPSMVSKPPYWLQKPLGGPCWRYITANVSQAWSSMTLVDHDHLQGPHASVTGQSSLMAMWLSSFPCHLGWRTLLKCNKTNHACLSSFHSCHQTFSPPQEWMLITTLWAGLSCALVGTSIDWPFACCQEPHPCAPCPLQQWLLQEPFPVSWIKSGPGHSLFWY